ncbi:phasin family protein [Rhodobium gokarnense]|uniref:Phasin family protein n=1 Tax=Rhodobium gokarnense TaxID=364296 RepID=A0ABT3HA35_9HYPH|nr:phasin family protein [Rhodobium gokarnense]MCW2307253.1 phasin family protein [Rhodobium gokarnense]
MFAGFEDLQKLNKDQVDTALKNFGNINKGFQKIAAEMADYSKKSFEDGASAMEQLMAAKSLDKAMEVQSDYYKSAYEDFVGQATKISEMYVDLAKDAYKPYEEALGKMGK